MYNVSIIKFKLIINKLNTFSKWFEIQEKLQKNFSQKNISNIKENVIYVYISKYNKQIKAQIIITYLSYVFYHIHKPIDLTIN